MLFYSFILYHNTSICFFRFKCIPVRWSRPVTDGECLLNSLILWPSRLFAPSNSDAPSLLLGEASLFAVLSGSRRQLPASCYNLCCRLPSLNQLLQFQSQLKTSYSVFTVRMAEASQLSRLSRLPSI